MLLTINVTEQDIEDGKPDCGNCPVAIAGTRALLQAGFGRDWWLEYEPYRFPGTPDGVTIWRYDGGQRQVARLGPGGEPYEAYEFAQMFDDWVKEGRWGYDPPNPDCPAERPAPFSFSIELPIDCLAGRS